MKGATQMTGYHWWTTLAISIHAPVKGATAAIIADAGVLLISIHAPVKGATRSQHEYGFLYSNFNPRTREGCDGMVP